MSDATALHTDHYELTMLQAALQSGAAENRCVFEVFARSLPRERRFGVLAGTGRLLEQIVAFRFDADALEWLTSQRVVDRATCEWLSSYRFQGSIDGYSEGEVYLPHSPVLIVEGSFAECVILETLILSILNHDTAVATAAARMVGAAGERPLIEMGSRRTHEESAIAAARAAWIAGFAASSNLAAGKRWGVPTTGTAAHAFTLVHASETEAFRAQVDALGVGTTLLVDTYDVLAAIRQAVAVAGPELGAIRLDSGDLASLTHQARALLDSLGATGTRIIVSGDLDEWGISALSAAPVDGYGVGTSVVAGSGAPAAGFVYKLVATDAGEGWRVVAKKSPGKVSVGGRKWATRLYDDSGVARVEHISTSPGRSEGRQLQQQLIVDGQIVADTSVAVARRRCADSIAELPPDAAKLSPGEPVLHVELGD